MSFDRLAPFYRGMEFILAGNRLQRCRLEWLKEVGDCRQVLVAGEGPGRFLTECVKHLPRAQIICVDASAAMLARARKALQRVEHDPARVTFLRASLPEWRPPLQKSDLIVTHFFLDCFPPEQLKQVIFKLTSSARPDARWLLADFCEPERRFARLRAKLILKLAYACFRMVTDLPAHRLIAPDKLLEENGFRRQKHKTYDWGLLYSDLWISNSA